LTALLEGLPAGVPVDLTILDAELARRQEGYGRGGRMAIERDEAQITAGVRGGLTLGSPVALVIANRDWENWRTGMQAGPWGPGAEPEKVRLPRPGHADLAGAAKFGHTDLRNVLERASARETAARVAAGALCRQFLDALGIRVGGWVTRLGGVPCGPQAAADPEVWSRARMSDVACPDPAAAVAMRAAIDAAREAGDTVGGRVRVEALGLPPGLGSVATWEERLDGRLAQALMSIPAIKGVMVGEGWAAADGRGSQVHDALLPAPERPEWPYRHASNRAGGVEGGMTNGEPLVVEAAMKPIPTLLNPLPSVDLDTGEARCAHIERSDVCAVPAALVVAEAMVCLVLAEAMRDKFGGDSLAEVRANLESYRLSLAARLRGEG
jgi:chorismate synthase